MRHKRFPVRAFTLVELLVVIGIIALLITILLPTLANARRQAQAVKCAAALRSIGQAFLLYSIDNHGYAPPWRAGNTSGVTGGAGGSYNLYGIAYNSPTDVPGVSAKDACFWFDFLAKYLTKSHGGSGDANLVEQKETQASVIWGCPNWDGYQETVSGTGQISQGGAGLNRQYTGYSYNYEPDMGPGYPMVAFGAGLYYGQYSNDIRSSDNFSSNNWSTTNNQTPRWFKLTDYRPADQRAIVGDSHDWKLEAQPWDGTGGTPPQSFRLPTKMGTVYPSSQGGRAPGTTFDYYRHGIYPKPVDATAGGFYSNHGGKIAYNILYADGHVMTSHDISDGYRSMFIEFPFSNPSQYKISNPGSYNQ